MTIGVFVDRTKPPTREDILTSIGPMAPLWDRSVAFIAVQSEANLIDIKQLLRIKKRPEKSAGIKLNLRCLC